MTNKEFRNDICSLLEAIKTQKPRCLCIDIHKKVSTKEHNKKAMVKYSVYHIKESIILSLSKTNKLKIHNMKYSYKYRASRVDKITAKTFFYLLDKYNIAKEEFFKPEVKMLQDRYETHTSSSGNDSKYVFGFSLPMYKDKKHECYTKIGNKYVNL